MAELERIVGRTRWRAIGVALIVYGAAGILLLAAAALALTSSLSSVEELARSSSDVRATLAATRDAFDGFGTSLVEGRESAERAAASARSSAAAAKRLADAMLSIDLFGARPLQPIATGFQSQSADLGVLAGELDDLAAALGGNEGDVAALRDQLATLYDRTAVLEESDGAGSLGPLAYALFAWLALQAFAAVWAGVTLWHAAEAGRRQLLSS